MAGPKINDLPIKDAGIIEVPDALRPDAGIGVVDQEPPPLECNYLGGSGEELQDQLVEINNDSTSPLISIQADSANDHYCTYRSEVAGDFIREASFQTPYRLLTGEIYPTGDYLYFPMETVPKEIKTVFDKR